MATLFVQVNTETENVLTVAGKASTVEKDSNQEAPSDPQELKVGGVCVW